MAVTIVRGANKKPVSSDELAQYFEVHGEHDGQLFLGYPIIGTSEGRYAIDAVWLSCDKGIVLFDLVEGTDIGDYQSRQDEAANLLESKLRSHLELVARRKLLVPIQTVTYAPAVTGIQPDDEYIVSNTSNIEQVLLGLENWGSNNQEVFEKALSAIQSISTIRRTRSKRVVQKQDSRGAKLKRLEDSIATLDAQQGKAVVETVDGVQRIRGLAGSGKTIVLALKAAYLHAQHPEWRIAVTFNTRSLKGQFHRLINTFCIEQTGEEPNWENLRILNAWGAPGGDARDGIYYEFCKVHDISFYDYRSAKKFGRGQEFAGACKEALNAVSDPESRYDAILVDEAQDFPPVFLQLCYRLLPAVKRLVYAYDELQNLSGESLPSPEELFGKSKDGMPFVQLINEPGRPKRDILLNKCYRNSRPVLVSAHSLGFGIYRTPLRGSGTGLVQMFDHPGLWEEVGYQVKSGELAEGRDVVLVRSDETSPKFLEEHSTLNDLVQFHRFQSEEEQADWLVAALQKNIEEDELRHDDIIVINPDPISTRNKVGPIRKKLYDKGVDSHLAGVDTDPDVFYRSGKQSITFTGIYRAKGNEAGMVYIINANDCQSSAFNLSRIRNRLFTAITRSKAWVRVLGVGAPMDRLVEEFERLKSNDFELRFRYPTQEEREKLRIVHRDMTAQEKKKLASTKKGLAELLEGLESGVISPEDLDEAMLRKLEKLLLKKQ